MQLSCLQENLARGLNTVGRAVASRSTLPITQNVLLRTEQGMLQLTATNLEISITTHIGAMVEQEGAITVPHKMLSDLVGSFPSDRVDLTVPDGENDTPGTQLNIGCGRSSTQMNGGAARDFPAVTPLEKGVKFGLEGAILRECIGKVVFSAASDDNRPVLTGVYLKADGDRMTMASADGFRLTVVTQPLAGNIDLENSIIIPAQTMHELYRLLNGAGRVTAAIVEGRAQFDFDQTRVITQLIQGAFPNYDQLIPDRYETRAVLDVADLKNAVDTARVFAATGSNIVRLEMKPDDGNDGGIMMVSARSEEVGFTERGCTLEALDGSEGRIAFNVRYLRDIANVLGKGNMAIELTNSSSPGVFRPADLDDFVHVVMPMYVQW